MTKRTAGRPRLRAVALALVALAGAVVGTAWDRLHVAAGTLFYPAARFGQPWWVPVEFGLAFVGIVAGVVRLGDPAPTKGTPARAVRELAWFTAMYALSALLWTSPAACALVLALLLALRVDALQAAGERNALPAFALVVAGPVVEGALVAAGLFAYDDRGLLIMGIPVWLPVLYMHAVPLAVRTAELALLLGGVRRAVEDSPA